MLVIECKCPPIAKEPKMKPIRTLVVVANTHSARIYEGKGPHKGLTGVKGGSFESPPAHGQDIYADRGGRSFDSHGKGRHAMEPPTSPEQHALEVHARKIATWIDATIKDERFQRLVLIAPSQALGALRNQLSPQARQLLAVELEKNLVDAEPATLVEALSDKLVL